MPVIAAASGTTVGQMVDRVIRTLLGSRRVEINRATNAIADQTADTQIVVDFPIPNWNRGTLLEVDREAMYVLSVDDRAARTVTVLRGHLGTPVGAHTADSLVRVDPVWTRQEVFDALLAEVRELNGTGLRSHATIELTAGATARMYDLEGAEADEVLGIYDVRYADGDGDSVTHRATYRFVPDANTDDFPSGYALLLLEGGEANYALRVTYTRAFSDFEAEGDVLGTASGLPVYAEDVLRFGAAYRLAVQQEGARVEIEASPGSRRGEDVPVTSNARLVEQLNEMRERALSRAIARQNKTYPMRMRG